MKKNTITNQKGAVLIIFALLLLVLIGFTALAVEAGRWYMVRAELSKSVDAAALAGAKNISNPYVDPLVLAQEFGQANFPTGYAGTPAMGTTGAVTFNASSLPNNRIQVTGSVSALAYLAQLFGVKQVATSATGAAAKNDVEIMLVLDRSTSMQGRPLADLKQASQDFLNYFSDTQAEDRLGLVSFATDVVVNSPLGNNYYDAMFGAIQRMQTWSDELYVMGDTNASEAIEKAGGPQGLQDQSMMEPAARRRQFLIFFTDGQPTAFRATFRHYGNDIELVAGASFYRATGACVGFLGYYDPNSGSVNPLWPPGSRTGDGLAPETSRCNARFDTYKWYTFETYPLAGHGPEECMISDTELCPYICDTGRKIALKNAQALKDRGVMIYTIGLGNLDQTFLHQVASGTKFEYYTPNSGELRAIFNNIAKDIKLRLVK